MHHNHDGLDRVPTIGPAKNEAPLVVGGRIDAATLTGCICLRCQEADTNTAVWLTSVHDAARELLRECAAAVGHKQAGEYDDLPRHVMHTCHEEGQLVLSRT